MTTSRFEIVDTPLAGLKVVTRSPTRDSRGYLCRLYCSTELSDAGFNKCIAQINHSLTRCVGAVRGMHFQYPPSSEMKMVTCIKGEVFDVAVDLRYGSPTFLKWHGEYLTDKNFNSMLIPEGFAHGFQAMTSDAELIYFHSEFYCRDLSGSINVNDPAIKILWPLAITDISEQDLNTPLIDKSFEGVLL